MDKLVVYIDGACEPKNPRGVPTYGFVIYDDGKKLDQEAGLAAEPWTKQATNNVAEYTAMIKALEKILTLGLQDSDIEVRSDSQLLVNQVNRTWKVRTPRLKSLFERVNELRPKFRNLQLKWIQRDENAEADALTKEAYESYVAKNPKHEPTKVSTLATPNTSKRQIMFCYQCGAQIPADSKFCKECGTRLV